LVVVNLTLNDMVCLIVLIICELGSVDMVEGVDSIIRVIVLRLLLQ
jgi:hypothetical protein